MSSSSLLAYKPRMFHYNIFPTVVMNKDLGNLILKCCRHQPPSPTSYIYCSFELQNQIGEAW